MVDDHRRNAATLAQALADENQGYHQPLRQFTSTDSMLTFSTNLLYLFSPYGGQRLAEFTEGLVSSRVSAGESDGNIALFGHSYGSLTTGYAADNAAPGTVDKVIVFGSPGIGVQVADELNIPDHSVFVSAVSPVHNAVQLREWVPIGDDFGGNPTSLDIETIRSIGDAHFVPLGFTSAQPAPSDSTISFHWVDKRNGGYIRLIASDGGMTIRGTSDFRPTSQHFNADVCDNNYGQSDWERALPIHPDELVRATKDGLIPQSDAQNATPQSTP